MKCAVISKDVIEEAQALFGNSVIVERDRVLIYPTDWYYEEPHYFHNDSDLLEYIDEEIKYLKESII